MNKLKRYTIIGTIFVIITGTISHFIYEWSGNNFILGFFFPVNESTWEHMKLCFFPMLIYSLFMNKKLKDDYPCVASALLSGILLGTFLIPVIFFTYTGILGRNYLPLDIATFVFSVIIAFVAVYKLTLSCKMSSCNSRLGLSVFIMAVCFFVFTYLPPDIGLFIAPEWAFILIISMGIPDADILAMCGWETDYVMKTIYRHSMIEKDAKKKASDKLIKELFN